MSEDKTPLVPNMRFPEFEGNGEWEKKSLGDETFVEIFKGKGLPKSDLAEDGTTPCIRYAELYTHYDERIETVLSATNVSPSNLFLSSRNDVLIPCSGETKIDIATAACVLVDGVGLGGDLNVLRADADGSFLSYYINGNLKRTIAAKAQGDSVVHLYPSHLRQVALSIPSLSEQSRIAECLSSLDDLIKAEIERLEALRAHKKGVMQSLFPREGETTPHLRFPEFEGRGEWKEMNVKANFDFVDGFAFASTDFVKSSNHAYQVIRITDINSKNSNDDKVYLPVQLAKKIGLEKKMIKKGDMLLSMTGNFGFKFFEWLEEPALLNQRTIKFSPKSEKHVALTKLLNHLIGNQLNEQGTGKQNNLSKSTIEQANFAAPPTIAEQQRIADCQSSLDDLITAQSNRIDALKLHKIGLMQGLFSKMGDRP